MRILVILLLVCALYGAYQWWQDRSPSIEVSASPNGFVPVEMPGGVGRDSVLVLAPRNCPSEQAQKPNGVRFTSCCARCMASSAGVTRTSPRVALARWWIENGQQVLDEHRYRTCWLR